MLLTLAAIQFTHVVSGTRLGPLAQLRAIFGVPNHRRAFAFMIMLFGSVFTVVPFIAAYNVANVGVTEADLAVIYFAGGAASLVTAQVIGRLADRYGTRRLFSILALISLAPILIVTHLPPLSLYWVVPLSVLFFVFVPGRFGPATALVTGSVVPRLRGSFMSFNASIQQFASGSLRSPRGLSSDAPRTVRSRTTVSWAGCPSGVPWRAYGWCDGFASPKVNK